MKVFAQKFRGFKDVEVDLDKLTFLVGDNSSGKSSILHLVQAVTRSDLQNTPYLDEDFGVGQYDYFSPYFNEDDVIFGFYEEQKNDFYAKLITVECGKKSAPPKTVKCSYLVKGTFISFKKNKDNLFIKIYKELDIYGKNVAIDLHNSDEGYDTVKLIRGIDIGNPALIIATTEYKSMGLEKVVETIFKTSLCDSLLSSPTRALPAKFYAFKRKLHAQGLHFATMWFDFSGGKSGSMFKAIDDFGKESGLFDEVKVKKISSKIKESPLIVSVVKSGRSFLLNQVGVGVSQVVPVLVDCIFSMKSKNTTILIQQPELHLHPVAQAALGTYLYLSRRNGLTGVIETHSAYLLDRFRSEVRDKNSENEKSNETISDDAVIKFCKNMSEGNVSFDVSILQDGNIVGEPEDYHKFFIGEMMRTMF